MKGKIIIIVMGVLVIVVGGIFTGYIMPHGKAVNSLNTRYTMATNEISTSVSTIDSTTKVQEFRSAVSLIESLDNKIDGIQNELKSVEGQRNWLRDTWKKPSFNMQNIHNQKSLIQVSIDSIPEKSKVLLLKTFSDSSKRLEQTSSWSKIKEELGTVKRSSETIAASLFIISDEEEKKKANKSSVFDSNKREITVWADSSINAIKRCRLSERKSYDEKIKNCNAVKDVVVITQASLSKLLSIKDVLTEAAPFKPSSRLLNSEYSSIRQDGYHMNAILKLASRIVTAQKDANNKLKAGIIIMDGANRRLEALEEYAQAYVINQVHYEWKRAVLQIKEAKSSLAAPSSLNSLRRETWINCNRKANSNIDHIYDLASRHKDLVSSKYHEAARQESTIGGRVTRGVQRGLNRLRNLVSKKTEEFSRSRMGREIGVSVKTLILGTKAFYDLQDPDKDIMTWAMSYESDVDQLIDEVDEIQRMKQPSITGKNTFIEDMVNKAYESSFDKENELSKRSTSSGDVSTKKTTNSRKKKDKDLSTVHSSNLSDDIDKISEEIKEEFALDDKNKSKVEKIEEIPIAKKEERTVIPKKTYTPPKEMPKEKKKIPPTNIPKKPSKEHIYLEKFVGVYGSGRNASTVSFKSENTLGIKLAGFGGIHDLIPKGETRFDVKGMKRFGVSFNMNPYGTVTSISISTGTMTITYDKE